MRWQGGNSARRKKKSGVARRRGRSLKGGAKERRRGERKQCERTERHVGGAERLSRESDKVVIEEGVEK